MKGLMNWSILELIVTHDIYCTCDFTNPAFDGADNDLCLAPPACFRGKILISAYFCSWQFSDHNLLRRLENIGFSIAVMTTLFLLPALAGGKMAKSTLQYGFSSAAILDTCTNS
jgi:hypothetical protein